MNNGGPGVWSDIDSSYYKETTVHPNVSVNLWLNIHHQITDNVLS